jgi:integrase
VRELRDEELSEWTIAGILKSARRVFKFAERRLNWHGRNPIDGLENGERPKTGATLRRRLFEGAELAQTIAAASEPLRTLFSFAACTGARESECLGLIWSDVDLADLDVASVSFAFQVDRKGKRQPLKTEESRRTIELPRSLAVLLAEQKARSGHSQPGDFVFGTRSGRPISQRNALRGLRGAMKAATDEKGRPTFPVLSAVDERGRPMPVPRGSVPNFHGLRHTAASEAIRDGESAEEVSWQLGHKNSNVTRAVYVQEIKTAERSARRRAKMEARYGSLLEAAARSEPKQTANGSGAKVVDLEAKRSRAK